DFVDGYPTRCDSLSSPSRRSGFHSRQSGGLCCSLVCRGCCESKTVGFKPKISGDRIRVLHLEGRWRRKVGEPIHHWLRRCHCLDWLGASFALTGWLSTNSRLRPDLARTTGAGSPGVGLDTTGSSRPRSLSTFRRPSRLYDVDDHA